MNTSTPESGYAIARRAPGSTKYWIQSLFVVLIAGCGGGPEYPHATVNGTVKVNGTPVEQGRVTCFHTGQNGSHVISAEIVNGSFQIANVPLGTNVFTFAASSKTGKTIPGPGGVPEPELVNLIPKKFSTDGITREITDDGVQEFEIDGPAPP